MSLSMFLVRAPRGFGFIVSGERWAKRVLRATRGAGLAGGGRETTGRFRSRSLVSLSSSLDAVCHLYRLSFLNPNTRYFIHCALAPRVCLIALTRYGNGCGVKSKCEVFVRVWLSFEAVRVAALVTVEAISQRPLANRPPLR